MRINLYFSILQKPTIQLKGLMLKQDKHSNIAQMYQMPVFSWVKSLLLDNFFLNFVKKNRETDKNTKS